MRRDEQIDTKYEKRICKKQHWVMGDSIDWLIGIRLEGMIKPRSPKKDRKNKNEETDGKSVCAYTECQRSQIEWESNRMGGVSLAHDGEEYEKRRAAGQHWVMGGSMDWHITEESIDTEEPHDKSHENTKIFESFNVCLYFV